MTGAAVPGSGRLLVMFVAALMLAYLGAGIGPGPVSTADRDPAAGIDLPHSWTAGTFPRRDRSVWICVRSVHDIRIDGKRVDARRDAIADALRRAAGRKGGDDAHVVVALDGGVRWSSAAHYVYAIVDVFDLKLHRLHLAVRHRGTGVPGQLAMFISTERGLGGGAMFLEEIRKARIVMNVRPNARPVAEFRPGLEEHLRGAAGRLVRVDPAGETSFQAVVDAVDTARRADARWVEVVGLPPRPHIVATRVDPAPADRKADLAVVDGIAPDGSDSASLPPFRSDRLAGFTEPPTGSVLEEVPPDEVLIDEPR